MMRTVRWLWAPLTGLVLLPWLVWSVEEPELRRRFGEAYDRYAQAVPRWVPARLPWRPCGGGDSTPISGAPSA